MEIAKRRKVLEGTIVSAKVPQMVTVQVVRRMRHPKYEKLIEKRKKFYAHHERDNLQVGQKVRIMECRPMSKLKRWLVIEVV